MRILLILLLLNSGLCAAGDVTELSPSETSSMNFNFVAWPDLSSSEIEEHKKKAHCTPVEFSMPLQISEEKPDWTQVIISGEIYLLGKVLSGIATYSFEIKEKNLAHICLPFGAEYTVNLELSYMPTDLKKMPMCPVTFRFDDFKRFVEFKISE